MKKFYFNSLAGYNLFNKVNRLNILIKEIQNFAKNKCDNDSNCENQG